MLSYLRATRHPWPCLMFLFPLLLAYELGVIFIGGADANALRNGADVWVRRSLNWYGIDQIWVPPLVLLLVLFVWTWWRWSDRPREPLAACFGMAIESAVFAGLLFLVSRNFRFLVDQSGLNEHILNQIQFQAPAAGQLITFVGAGIYEEALFRLGLFRIISLLLRVALPNWFGKLIAAILAALAFAAAHHIGENSESIVPIVFFFRTMAGLFFTLLYIWRGFGIAVGAHAGYDVLVGVAVA